MNKKYQELSDELKRLSHLGSILGHLGWDMQSKLPKGAFTARQNQMTALTCILHEQSTSEDLGKLIYDLYEKGSDGYNDLEWKNISLAKRSFEDSIKIPSELIKRRAEISGLGFQKWLEAKQSNNYQIFAPLLQQYIDISRECSHHLNPEKHPYDVCLDGFERGYTSKDIDAIFSQLKLGLSKIYNKIQAKGSIAKPLPKQKFEISKQVQLIEEVAVALGFDKNIGRIDTSEHPFTGGGHNTDVRMTTRYDENDLNSALLSIIHETGHAIYEQGRRTDQYQDTPVSMALGMVVHESQSLLLERRVGQSRAFAEYCFPLIQKYFPEQFTSWTPEDYYLLVNQVGPSELRIEADELTYPLHIILRYELEKDLFNHRIEVKDLNEAWNERSLLLLGFKPESEASGVLQDAHWGDGCFGYFPVYTLGAMAGSQMYETFLTSNPDAETNFAKGDFSNLKSWMNKNIHAKGQLQSAKSLISSVTGTAINVDNYLTYLDQKYKKIYNY
ncbi:MAG: carboxypeptidase M32 [Candidatus Cloacimonetes bacterium]|nr:carboxypeptidase M32 [Candidatus Cloacimonadota bacterium]